MAGYLLKPTKMAANLIIECFNFKTDGSTHIDFGKGKKLRLKSGKYGEFTNQYIDLYTNDQLEDLCLGEKVPEEPPIIINLEFIYPYNEDNEKGVPYTTGFLSDVLFSTQKVIRNMLDIDDSNFDPKLLYCALVVTSPYKVVEHNCFNVTIFFPSIRMIVSDQRKILRPKLLLAYRKDNIQYGLKVAVTGDISSFLPLDTLNDYFPMLGCVKNSSARVEQQILYFNDESKQITDDVALIHWNPLNNMDAAKYSYPITEGDIYLPLVLSARYQGSKILEFNDDEEDSLSSGMVKERIEEEICRTMLAFIDLNARIKNVVYRNIIGKAMYNIYKKDPDNGFDLWFNCCKKVLRDLVEEDYRNTYENFSSNNYYTEITLQTFAKQDNPKEYRKWDAQNLTKLLNECISNLSAGVYSRALTHLYKLTHTYISNGKKGSWYVHNGTYLDSISMEDPGIDFLRKKIKILENENNNNALGADRGRQQSQEAFSLKCFKALDFMDKAATMTGIGKFLRIAFSKRTFNVRLNANQNIFCASNLVLESTRSTQGMVPRPGLLEDYFTFHGYVPYNENLTEQHPFVLKERDFSGKIYGCKEKMEYMDNRRSRRLVGINNEKSLTLEIGPPNAGKTSNAKIDKMEFGEFLFSGNTTMLTGAKGSSSNATPDTAHTDNKRDVRFDDPDSPSSGTLNEGWLCQETGGSNRHTRFTYEDGMDHPATAEYSIAANDLKFNPTQQLIIRIVVVMYNSKHLDDEDEITMDIKVPDTLEEQRKLHIYRKQNFTDKDYREMAIARLWRDVRNHFKINWNKNTPRPDIIRKETKKWWDRTDPYHKFVKTHIRADPSRSTRMSGEVLYACYSAWFRASNPNMSIHDMSNFNRCIKGVIGEPDDDDIYIRYKLFDSKFIDFVEGLYDVIDDKKVYILAAEAYNEYKNWERSTNMSKLIRDYYAFIAYMSSSCVNYDDDIKGFRGLVKKILPAPEVTEVTD